MNHAWAHIDLRHAHSVSKPLCKSQFTAMQKEPDVCKFKNVKIKDAKFKKNIS